jgi:hypothetical protein
VPARCARRSKRSVGRQVCSRFDFFGFFCRLQKSQTSSTLTTGKLCHKSLFIGWSLDARIQEVRANSLFKLENRNRTRLVQKPKWTRLRGKSENVYSGTRTLCLIDRGKTRKSVYRSTHFHFCPYVSSDLASVPISSDFDFQLK